MTDPTRIDIDFDPTRQRMSGVTIHGNVPFDVPFISQVSGNLWQGGCQDNLVLPEEIKHVISLYPWEQYRVAPFHELDSMVAVRLYDGPVVPDERQLETLTQWINVCRTTGPTLVHCQAGLNRSALLCSLALMRGPEQLTAKEAIDLLREKRSPAVLCNKTFENWLLHDA